MTTAATAATAERHGLATLSEVMGYLRLSKAQVYRLIGSGELKTVHIGRLMRVTWTDLESFVESHRDA